MHYIVFDLEWNQKTGPKKPSQPGLPCEIIEIGAIKLDRAGRIVSRFSEVVCPVVYVEMSVYTEQVTHMDMEELKKGRPFGTVCREFLDWCGENPCFCTWGSMDLDVLQQNMTYFGVEYSFSRPLVYYDVQKMHSLEYCDGKERKALDCAVMELGITHGNDFHRALQDAYYTACVWKKLSKSMKRFFSVDYYELPGPGQGPWKFDFGTYQKQVTKAYPKKTGALYDKDIRLTKCPKCDQRMEEIIGWFPVHNKLCATLLECPLHGMYQAKLRLRQDKEEAYFAIKTLKPASEERRKRIENKYESYLKLTEPMKNMGSRKGERL